jgi:hypothetical protein
LVRLLYNEVGACPGDLQGMYPRGKKLTDKKVSLGRKGFGKRSSGTDYAST